MDKIEVTQADREAAASGYYVWVSANQTVPNRMRAGDADFHSMVQAFARHRLATRTDATPVAWMPIDSAPKDGTVIDAWRDDRRETVYWGLPPHTCGEMGDYCDSDWHGIKGPGWICATFGEFVGCKHDPLTHWMPLPAAPDATNTHPPATDVAALVEHFRRMIEACANYVEPATYIARHPTGELCKWNTEFPEPRKHQSIDGALATTRRRGQAFISDIIYMLDGPEQRAALAPFTKGQP